MRNLEHPGVRSCREAENLGSWSAVIGRVCSVAYDLAQIAEWIGLLYSMGGSSSSSTSLGLAILFKRAPRPGVKSGIWLSEVGVGTSAGPSKG